MMSRKLKSTKVIRINLSPEGQELRQNLLSLTEYHEKNEKAVKEIQYSPEGEPEQITCYEYDAKGYLISEEIKEGDETLVSKRTFEVDDNGRVEREFHHYSDGSVDTIDYGYNSLGQLVEKVVTDYEGDLFF
jgi:YD repeat-containing protein